MNDQTQAADVRIGTSSFSSPDWKGSFYPIELRPGEFLSYYSKFYNTVEIDSTYYGIPRQTTVIRWFNQTPDDFLFSVKFPRSIVHAGEKAVPDRQKILSPEHSYHLRDQFLEMMQHLGSKFGFCLLQFPYFSKKIFPDPTEFYDRLEMFLDTSPREFNYVVEIRNRYWLSKRLEKICDKFRVGLAMVDQAWMPHGDEQRKTVSPYSANFLYIRLLGDRNEIEKITKKWDKLVIDRSVNLRRWAILINEEKTNFDKIVVYCNNHYAGNGLSSANELRHLLGYS